MFDLSELELFSNIIGINYSINIYIGLFFVLRCLLTGLMGVRVTFEIFMDISKALYDMYINQDKCVELCNYLQFITISRQ